MNQPDGLLDGIRRKILDGTLPKQNCRMTWYGPGTGASAWRAIRSSRPTTWRSSVIYRPAGRFASTGGVTTSGRRSGPVARREQAADGRKFPLLSRRQVDYPRESCSRPASPRPRCTRGPAHGLHSARHDLAGPGADQCP